MTIDAQMVGRCERVLPSAVSGGAGYYSGQWRCWVLQRSVAVLGTTAVSGCAGYYSGQWLCWVLQRSVAVLGNTAVSGGAGYYSCLWLVSRTILHSPSLPYTQKPRVTITQIPHLSPGPSRNLLPRCFPTKTQYALLSSLNATLCPQLCRRMSF
jgi:hypothetical protein